ncbi:MAG: Hsp33 family molecular chaperone HslO [Porticoccus sp.]|nr:Hsp33 family molecular chaperone HslO [Porticoccus sp.]MBQ0808491.1 Hsp33 family molecular chaperone HslO [Porticoccus sp.]MDX2349749.1 Hsp33 family molecular chaperone HslO [Porticoccus sp.]
MSHTDQLQRFIFEHSDIRGEILTLEKSYQDVLANGEYPETIQQLLGQFLTAAGLLSATLKFDGVITLQAQGSGPLSMIMADCTRHHNLRAIAQFDPDQLYDSNTSLTDLIGEGTLTLTVDPSQGKRYQGVVPLESGSLATCLEDYFARSEQLATRIWLSADIQSSPMNNNVPRAAGLLLQALPNQLELSPEENRQLWDHAIQLADTITKEEQLTLSHEEQLYRLFHQDELRLFEPDPVQFFCSCSEGRFTHVLLSLGHEELNSILEEQDIISINCQFCHQQYRFNEKDIAELFGENPPMLH